MSEGNERIARWVIPKDRRDQGLASDGTPYVVCSLCGGSRHLAYPEVKGTYKYCYECGAKMDNSDTKPGVYAD